MEAGDPFLQELEDAGLNEVKARLAAKIYSPIGPKSDIAKDWVLRKEQALEVETRRLEDAPQSRTSTYNLTNSRSRRTTGVGCGESHKGCRRCARCRSRPQF